MTECIQSSFGFKACGSREIVARFDGGTISSDAGAFLLRETDKRLNLLPRLAECFLDGRDQALTDHSVLEMLSQRVYGLALGYEDINDHDQLRKDPVFGILAGREELDEPLAGKSTLNRMELGAGTKDRYKKITFWKASIDELLVDVFLEAHRNWCPPFGGGSHSGLPLPARGLCLVPDEAIADNCADGLKHIWVVDVSAPTNPVTISTLPTPSEQDYTNKGGHFGPHNVHENREGSFQSSELIFATYQNAGLRIFDLADPFAPKEAGHFVPPSPALWTDYRPNRPRVIHSSDVYVSADGLMYLTDFSGGGLDILQYEGI